MSNNLKFRAYDTKRKEWCFSYEKLGGFSLIGEVVLMGELNSYSLEDLCENIKFMQWTGLKDKNGEDIYDGDFVKCGNSKDADIALIVFRQQAFMLMFFPNMKEEESVFEYMEDYEYYEVKGNVYQNTELIN